VVNRAIFYAKDAARRVENNYHSQKAAGVIGRGRSKRAPIRHAHESDTLTDDGDSYVTDGLYGSVSQSADIGDFKDHLSSELKRFGAALYRQPGQRLFNNWILLQADREGRDIRDEDEDVTALTKEERRELRVAFNTFVDTGWVPVSRKVVAAPKENTSVFTSSRLPADAENTWLD
jgi:hypothetical protein